MSNDLELRCVSHNPYINSGEVGRNLSYLPQVREDVKNRDKIVELMREVDYWDFQMDTQYRTTTAYFLYNHPRCELELWDEYGVQYPLEVEEEDDLDGIGVNTVLGKATSVLENPDGITITFELNEDGKRLMDKMKRKGLEKDWDFNEIAFPSQD